MHICSKYNNVYIVPLNGYNSDIYNSNRIVVTTLYPIITLYLTSPPPTGECHLQEVIACSLLGCVTATQIIHNSQSRSNINLGISSFDCFHLRYRLMPYEVLL